MDMKKILQAMDGISTKPVEGADSMAKFLRVVKEAEINQVEAVGDFGADPKKQAEMYLQFHTGMMDPSTLPAFMTVAPGISLAVQPPTNPTGSHEEVLASLSAANKRLPKDLQVSWDELKDISGVSDTIKLTGEPHPDTYNPTTDPVQESEATLPAVTPIKVPPIPQLPAQDGDLGSGVHVQTNRDGTRTYSSGVGTFTYDAQGKAITYATPEMMGLGQSINLANNQTTRKYNSGAMATSQRVDANGKPLETDIEYDLGAAKMRYNNDHAKGIRSAEFAPGPDFPTDLVSTKDMYAQGNKDRAATYDRAMAQVNGTPVQESSLRKFLSIVDKNNVSILNEGANPHKVALPVQMAMQHYQQPTTKPQPRERLIDKYFTEAEADLTQRQEEKRAVYNQYAKTIAERVLMKESKKSVVEGSDPNKLAASVTVDGEFKEFDLTPFIAKNNWVGDPKTVIKQADKWLGDFLRNKGLAYSNLKISYKGMVMNASQVGDVDSPDTEFESIAETPIEMTGDPNDPHIYGHEKANPMSLKGRIMSARAQLKELAQLSESDDLLVWERITQLHKGGMFMGLEQNLEQIRHGISELAAKRRKGGVQSRGINPHIGEGKRK
jgi:hypothetical protein